jgi:hypothetical protein
MARTARMATLLLTTLAVSAVALYGLRWLAQDVASATRGPIEPDVVVLAAVEVALLLTLARCALAGLLSVVALAARRSRVGGVASLALRASPRLVRPLVSAVLASGLAVTAGPASAATRSPGLPAAGWAASSVPSPSTPSPAPLSASPVQVGMPAAGWVPTQPAQPRVSAPEVSAVSAAPRRHVDVERAVVVRRGDCLWSVVARSLGPHASDARVAEQWPRWWAANRAVIGDDPALLLPGTRLHPPASPVAAR